MNMVQFLFLETTEAICSDQKMVSPGIKMHGIIVTTTRRNGYTSTCGISFLGYTIIIDTLAHTQPGLLDGFTQSIVLVLNI